MASAKNSWRIAKATYPDYSDSMIDGILAAIFWVAVWFKGLSKHETSKVPSLKRIRKGGKHMAATFELYRDKAGEYRWRLRHQNGRIIADSGEGYETRQGALLGIGSVKDNAPSATLEDQTRSNL